MKPVALFAAAAGAFVLAAPVAAQKPPSAPSEQEAAGDEQAMLAALQEAVAQLRSEMYAPGPAVANWNVGGADPDADLRRAGADDHYYLLTTADGTEVAMLTRRPIADFAPAGWRVVDSYGSAAATLDNPVVQFIPLSAHYIMGVRADGRRVGSVDCTDPIENAVLYEVPDAPQTEDDETLPIFFRIALLASEDQSICTRYDRDGEGYRMRTFLPDGRSLPQFDHAEDRITIIPAGPIDRLLRYVPRAAAGPST
jgi:hypothetical protein